MKKAGCGVVAHSSGGKEQLCVIGGFGELNLQQPAAEYFEDTTFPDYGWSNEFHYFISGEVTRPFFVYLILCISVLQI